MIYIFYDIILISILLFFAVRGRKRGLLLSLCSLLAVLVAFWGAAVVSNFLTPKVVDLLTPRVASVIEQRLFDMGVVHDDDVSAAGAYAAANGKTASSDSAVPGSALPDSAMNTIRVAVTKLGLPNEMLTSVENGLKSLPDIRDFPSALSTAIAHTAMETIVHLSLFSLFFVLILLLWNIFAHALNLITHLPVLHFLNGTGGFLFGLGKGILLLFVAAWFLRYLGNLVPNDAVANTHVLRFFMTADPIGLLTRGQVTFS